MKDHPDIPADAADNHVHNEHEAYERACKESPLAIRVRELLVGMDPTSRPEPTSPRCRPPTKPQ